MHYYLGTKQTLKSPGTFRILAAICDDLACAAACPLTALALHYHAEDK